MTFSDAEEDQPTMRANNLSVSSETSNSVGQPASESNDGHAVSPDGEHSGSGSNHSSDRQTSCHSGDPAASSSLMANSQEDVSTIADPSAPSSHEATASGDSSNLTQEEAHTGGNVAQHLASESLQEAASSSATSEATLAASMADNAPIKGLNADKVAEKLQKIQDYIQQTTSTMQALETEGDMTKIGHYNTLVKVLRDLRASEKNLQCHLEQMREKEAAKKAKSGSEAVGVVGNLTEGANPSMEERLARNQSEAGDLTARLRDSVARREELMARYRATRQRLNNLKDQRRAIVAEERNLLRSQGAPASPYENPIPGAETWTLEQLRSGLEDFQGLWDKVDRLQGAYDAKMRGTDPDDPGAVADVENKLQQLASKKKQLDDVLQQLKRLIRIKQNEGTGSEDQPPVAPSTDTSEALVNGESAVEGNHEANDEATEEFLPSGRALLGASSDITSISGDLASRKQELTQLQEQLSSMKQLLSETQSLNRTNKAKAMQQQQQQEQQRSSNLADDASLSRDLVEGAVGGMPPTTFVGLNGAVHHLTESEMSDPAIIEKFQHLSAAKKRLAKMEDIMKSISEAQMTGQPLESILSPECLEILNEARDEFEGPAAHRGRAASQNKPPQKEVSPEEMKILRNDTLPSKTPAVRSRIVEREESACEGNDLQAEQEMSTRQHYFNKNVTSTNSSPIEASRAQKEKSPGRKHTRNLWKESESSNKGSDPRLNELLALHEELKEKKNALEALTKRVGKSSTFAVDNLSDNLSDNILDNNSDTIDKHSGAWRSASGAATMSRLPDHSNDYNSDEDLAEEDFGNPLLPDAGQTARSHPPKDLYQERNKFNDPSIIKSHGSHRNSNQGRLSINNLGSSLPRSVRPRPNRSRGNMPKPTWENIEQGANARDSSKQNATFAQNTISYALAQLNMVQETINSLYKNLQQSCQFSVDSLPQQPTNLSYCNPFQLYSLPQLHPQMNFMTPPFASLSSNISEPVGRSDMNGPSNQILTGLHQCFSQLYLHSLEIQSLSKQLQHMEQKDKTPSPNQGRSTYAENRNSRPFWIPKPGEQDKPMPTVPPAPSPLPPPPGSSHSLCTPPQYEIPPHLNQNPLFPRAYHDNPTTRRTYDHFAGVVRRLQPFQLPDKSRSGRGMEPSPLAGALGSAADEPDLSFGNQNFFPPFEGSSVDESLERQGGRLLQPPPHIPLGSEEMPDNSLWDDIGSQQMQFVGSSDILNNQVPPGSRANNYWDNFRSYSHQNPLSNNTKQNICESPHMAQAVASSDLGRPLSNSKSSLQLSTSSLNGKREFNPTCNPNNFINKASEKNSATSRSLNKGARSRYPLQALQQRAPPYTGSSPANSLSSAIGEQRQKRAFKRNNRQNDGETFLQNQERERHGESSSNHRSDPFNFNFNLGGEKSVFPQRYGGRRDWCYPSLVEESLFDPPNLLNHVSHADNLEEASTKSDSHSQLRKEAELLMKKYAKQPEFLIHLFKHVSDISNNTDQQVALELLRELSNQRNNYPEIQQNSSSFRTPENSFDNPGNLPLLPPAMELSHRNQSNSRAKSFRMPNGAFGGSEASESGLTSEEEENKVFYRMFKNMTPSSSGYFPPNPPNLYGEHSADISPECHSYHGLAPGQTRSNDAHSLSELWKTSSKDGVNATATHLEREKTSEQIEDVERKLQETTPNRYTLTGSQASSLPNQELLCHGRSGPSNLLQDCKCNPLPNNKESYPHLRKVSTKTPLKDQNFRLSDSSMLEKMPAKNLNVFLPPRNISDAQPSVGFEALTTAALREVVRSFDWLRRNPMSPSQYLDALHPAIVRQVEKCSNWMGLNDEFVFSFDTQLKEVFQSFSAKQLPEIIQELAAAVSQVVVNQCCTQLLQNDSNSTTPQSNMQSDNLNIFLPFELCSNSPSPTQVSSSLNPCQEEFNCHVSSTSEPTSRVYINRPQSCNQSESAKSGAIQKNATSYFQSLKEPRNVASFSLSRNTENARSLRESSNLTKAMGAISKSTPHTFNNGATAKESESSESGLNESPPPESSFPESWIIPPIMHVPHGVDSPSPEVNQRLVAKKVNLSEEKDFSARDSLEMNTKDIEADQRKRPRNKEFHTAVLPGHDLAEADQSRDALEMDPLNSFAQVETMSPTLVYSQRDALHDPMDEGACGNSTSVSANASNVSSQEKEQVFQPISKKQYASKGTPEQGLDEVPTKLLNPGSCTSPLSNKEEMPFPLRHSENIQPNESTQGEIPLSDRSFNQASICNDLNSNSTHNGSNSGDVHSGSLVSDKSG